MIDKIIQIECADNKFIAFPRSRFSHLRLQTNMLRGEDMKPVEWGVWIYIEHEPKMYIAITIEAFPSFEKAKIFYDDVLKKLNDR